jgi:putative ABC transport system permease protein
MLAFHLRRAVRSLRRTPVMSAIMIVDMALGLSIWTIAYAAVSSHTRDPTRGDRVFHVDWGTSPGVALDDVDRNQQVLAHAPHMLLSYRDAAHLARHEAVSRSARTFTSQLAITTAHGPAETAARFCTRELFAMFELPFRFGGPWQAPAERRLAPEVVLDHESNRAFFGGENSVGRSIEIDGQGYRISGVLAPMTDRVRGYDFALSHEPAIYLPFDLFVPLGAQPDYLARRSPRVASIAELAGSDDAFVQLWVELDSAQQRARYQAFLDGAARARPDRHRLQPRLQPVAAWVASAVPVPSGFLIFEVCAFVALLACSVNLSRLLIVKFQARAPELALQRALGATRGSVFAQHMFEAVLVALVATEVALLIAAVSLLGINAIVPDHPADFTLDLKTVLLAGAMGFGAGVLAGVHPAIRMCRAAPAAFLRAQ